MKDKKAKLAASGKLLEQYKIWYYQQPKLPRIVFLPFLVAILVILIEYHDAAGYWLFAPGLLLLFSLYNQYLDSVIEDDLAEVKRRSTEWENLTEGLLRLNNIFNELVKNKSSIFLDAVEIASEQTKAEGIKSIRKSGCFDQALERIVAMLYKILESYADTKQNQSFRVTYLVPDVSGKHLYAKSWYNKDGAPPKSILKPNESYFTKGDGTLAGHLWGREDKCFLMVDNIEKHIKERGENAIVTYTHNGQKAYLKSICGYKVIDPKVHESLGILCIDSNVPDTLEKYRDYLQIVLDGFSQRMLFESRCAYMKEVFADEELPRNG